MKTHFDETVILAHTWSGKYENHQEFSTLAEPPFKLHQSCF